MNYIKLYESFKLSKFESDSIEYTKLNDEYKKKRKEIEDIKTRLSEISSRIQHDNKIDEMLKYILSKLNNFYLEESEYELDDDILDHLPESTRNSITQLNIEFDMDNSNNREYTFSHINGIHLDSTTNDWVIYIEEDEHHEYTIGDLTVNNIYTILQILMNDNRISGILNTNIFKQINK